MKKSLLFCLAVASCISPVMAETKTPTIYPDASFQRITPDGRFIVSEVYGTVTIYDLVAGTDEAYYADDYLYYSLGLGNCITPDASIIVGSTIEMGDAAYLQNGEWHQLNVLNEETPNLSNGITPDGSRICGSVGLSAMTIEDVIMQAPAYWDINADGNGYGECHVLPYPTKDFFGEKPQYVTAISITADGKTIVGQMRFSSGSMNVPIVYQQDEKGEWSYNFPTKHLFNPDGLEPVENPGDGPAWISYESYMTEEELEAYNDAVNEFYNNWTEESVYPDFEDFMSKDEIAAYKEALAKFEEEQAAWQEQFDAYWEYTGAVEAASPNFVFNNVHLSTDGASIVGTLIQPDPNADPWSWFSRDLYTPCSVDIATGEITKANTDISCLASGVADNGVILAGSPVGLTPMIGYVIKGEEIQEIEEYIANKNASYGEWIKKNMTHEVVIGWDPETEDDVIEEYTFTGMTIANPDMSVIAVWNDCPWDMMTFAEGVIFDMNATTGIFSIAAGRKNLSVENGNLIVPEGFASVEVFNVSGARVKNVNGAEGAVKLNLGNGVYIAKGTRLDGTTSIIKLSK